MVRFLIHIHLLPKDILRHLSLKRHLGLQVFTPFLLVLFTQLFLHFALILILVNVLLDHSIEHVFLAIDKFITIILTRIKWHIFVGLTLKMLEVIPWRLFVRSRLRVYVKRILKMVFWGHVAKQVSRICIFEMRIPLRVNHRILLWHISVGLISNSRAYHLILSVHILWDSWVRVWSLYCFCVINVLHLDFPQPLLGPLNVL